MGKNSKWSEKFYLEIFAGTIVQARNLGVLGI